MLVDVLERVDPDLFPGALRLQVDDLTRHEAVGADGATDLADNVQDRLGGDPVRRSALPGSRGRASNVLKGECHEGVSGQNRDFLSVDFVAGRDAAPEVVVVHAREVVMDQRHRVEHL